MVVLTLVFDCLTIGFVMIKCVKSFVDSIVSKLNKVEGVQYIQKVTDGPYTIITKIGAKDRNEIKERTEDIKNIDHIELTASLIVL
jgi:hypothetical protein